jgi:DNA modification methylase
VHTVVTSPPYFGLRDYGTGEWDGGGDPACDHVAPPSGGSKRASTLGPKGDGSVPGDRDGYSGDGRYRDVCGKCGATRVDRQIGLEPTPDEFVQALVQVFRQVRRVLRDDGTVWLNLGDSYSGYHGNARVGDGPAPSDKGEHYRENMRHTVVGHGDIKQKDLLGIPWMVAFALRADGWFLRSEIIWAKPNPMPESVTDRPTKAHEQLFLLSKRPTYFYDSDAIREQSDPAQVAHNLRYAQRYDAHDAALNGAESRARRATGGIHERVPRDGGRNKRSVWTVATQPYSGAHFATFPPKLIEPCVLAGCPEGGTVLDPFSGAGTTGLVALRNGRSYVGIELNPEYAQMARERLEMDVRLGHRPPVAGPAPIDGQVSMLDLLGEATA